MWYEFIWPVTNTSSQLNYFGGSSVPSRFRIHRAARSTKGLKISLHGPSVNSSASNWPEWFARKWHGYICTSNISGAQWKYLGYRRISLQSPTSTASTAMDPDFISFSDPKSARWAPTSRGFLSSQTAGHRWWLRSSAGGLPRDVLQETWAAGGSSGCQGFAPSKKNKNMEDKNTMGFRGVFINMTQHDPTEKACHLFFKRQSTQLASCIGRSAWRSWSGQVLLCHEKFLASIRDPQELDGLQWKIKKRDDLGVPLFWETSKWSHEYRWMENWTRTGAQHSSNGKKW